MSKEGKEDEGSATSEASGQIFIQKKTFKIVSKRKWRIEGVTEHEHTYRFPASGGGLQASNII